MPLFLARCHFNQRVEVSFRLSFFFKPVVRDEYLCRQTAYLYLSFSLMEEDNSINFSGLEIL